MKNRKFFAIILAMAIALAMFAGCDSGSGSKSGKKSSKSESEEEEDEDDEDDKKNKDSKKDKEDKKDKDSDDKKDPDGDVVIEKEETFEGFTDSTIKAMADEYEAMGYVVEPIMASDLGAEDYNYVEGFRMYLEEDPDTFFGWAKFDSSEDGFDFVYDVWIPNCEGYIAHEYYANTLTFFIDGLYGGSVDYNGLMEYVPYEGDGRENTASPEDFDNPDVAALCKEYQEKGFKVQADTVYDNTFTAYGVNENREHIAVYCKKYSDKETAKTYITDNFGYMSTVEPSFEDNDDGSVSFVIDGDEAYHVFPLSGTISEDGLLVYTYLE